MNKNKRLFIKLKFIAVIFFCIFVTSQIASVSFAADNSATLFNNGLKKVGGGAGYDNSLQLDQAENKLIQISGSVIQTLLSFLGVIFLILMVYAGFIWMTAKGDQQKVQKAKDILTNSLIGLIIVMAAYAISYFIISAIDTGIISFDSSTVNTQTSQ